MSRVAYSQHCYNCELESVEVYFEYNNSIVFDTGKKVVINDGNGKIKAKEVQIITTCELEEYESVVEAHRYSREDNLVIQGILSFFTGYPLTVYHSNKSSAERAAIKHKKREVCLRIENVDYTDELKILLNKLEEEPGFIITLLDRWRKAIYLKCESSDADLFYDEAILNFFHIFELFGESTHEELREKLEDNIADMLHKHFHFYYLGDKQIKQMVEMNKKSVNNLLIGDYLSLSVKIKFFLEKNGLLDENVSFFVDNMIKVRNAIAHGRITHQKVFMWPLPPFFSLAKDSYENIEFLFFLTAEMIAKYIGITCWEEEWKEAKEFLMPPKYVMMSFLEKQLVIENLGKTILYGGNKHNITWRTLFNYYVMQPKAKVRENMEIVTKDVFMNTMINEENAPDIFNISIIFADSEDEEIKEKAIANVKMIISKRWHTWSNFKDAYTYFQFYSVPVVWYKEFLINKGYRMEE